MNPAEAATAIGIRGASQAQEPSGVQRAGQEGDHRPTPPVVLGAYDARRARRASGLLREFNEAGVLSAADVHVAGRLGAIVGVEDEMVLLGAALAVRAPRLGHVCVDLATASSALTADVDLPVDLGALPWPEVDGWLERLASSPLVTAGQEAPADRPLRLVGRRLYLDRYWQEELQIVEDLRGRSRSWPEGVDHDLLAAGLQRLSSGGAGDLQRLASAVAVLRRFTVVAGGPGTGKTTTVARILALLDEQGAAGAGPPPWVALAAPTGKAAARLQEAVHAEAAHLAVGAGTRDRLLALKASTLHRLLGWRPDSHSRFRHHRANRLPHDVVVVDEASMVSLSLMAKLIDSVRTDARLVLVGDPDQLASVEAGAVLGDVVGPALRGMCMRPQWRAALAQVTTQEVAASDPPGGSAFGDGIVVLRQVHRYGGAIAALADAIQQGDADATVAALGGGGGHLRWIEGSLGEADAGPRLAPVRSEVVAAGRAVVEAAQAGDAQGALAALARSRILCAHRRGPYGVAQWTSTVEGWLASSLDAYGASGGRWYSGRPVMVTENDYALQLYNGDTGVVVDAGEGRVMVVFERRGQLVEISPSRLGAVETVHVMTVHKSQGSQFDAVVVLLPDASSPMLTRELLYTAVTRARTHLTVAGSEASIRTAVSRPIARASGLQAGLWG